ncbi:MAG TPA: RimK family alpha-L-glutamate ligase [bacterium]
MRIAILSRNKSLYSTNRLVRTAKKAGHRVNVIDPLKCNLLLGRDRHKVFYNSSTVDKFNIAITRIGASITDYGLAVVNQFDMMSIPVINDAASIARSRDKFRCLQLLNKHNIKLPRTIMVRSPENLATAIETIGGPPVIIKLLQGTHGIGVILAESIETIESTIDTLWKLGQSIMIQEFVKESRGEDIRAFVIGGEIVAAMRRKAKIGEFRTNIHRGGHASAIRLPEEFKKTAIKSAQVMGLKIAGVDMLNSQNGPMVMEVNSTPGFEVLEKSTGINIAKKIIEFAVNYAKNYSVEGPGIT